MSTRPTKAVFTARDAGINDCPNCGGLGVITDDELKFYTSMVRLAMEQIETPSLSVRSKLILVGMGLGLVGGAACMWIFMQLFG